MRTSIKHPSSFEKGAFSRLKKGVTIAAVLFAVLAGIHGARADDVTALHFETEASYTLGPGDSEPLARKLALFRAGRKAAYQAAERFEANQWIQFENKDRCELVSLVADRLASEVLRDHWERGGKASIYTVRIRAVVRLSDFIEAQLEVLGFRRQEATAGYRDEMSPPLPAPFHPGLSLAKAYWLIRNNELRIAIIYLDRLTQRYPNWGEGFELKAEALGLENQPDAMQKALQRACELGAPKACARLDSLESN
jgi:hypothetical protein